MTATETRPFQAEVQDLLGLMIHSLYSHEEIFLRELISNASDALDKLRFEALTRPELLQGDERLGIRIDVDRDARRVTVSDNGIGMSREEAAANLGGIARSGTRKFLESLREQGGRGPELIGQFGVGFYASFMVAGRIAVETRRAGESGGTRWSSSGDGRFTLETLDDAPRGTRVVLELKRLEPKALEPKPDAGEPDAQDFADPAVLRDLVRRYSDFVEWPIEMPAALLSDAGTLPRSKAEDGVEVARLNSQKPLWARPKDEIPPEEHARFFRHLTHGWSDPLETVHFKGEGQSEYTALLYVPPERPLELFDPARDRARIHLYVRRVFVSDEVEGLCPSWLRFLRGVVDSSDLPLNVSREILQQNRAVAQIGKRVARKTLEALGAMRDSRRADYERFWNAFGTVLKEGIVVDRDQADAILPLILCASTKSEQPTTLDEYVARMPSGQESIYVLAAESLEAARRSPLLEALTARGWEALLFVDPIDEWVLDRVHEHQGRKIARLERGEASELEGEAGRFDREQREREHRELLERLETELAPGVSKVRFSTRLKDSPAVLVDDPHSLGPAMERMMRHAGQEPPPRKRVLELNPTHPLIARLGELFRSDASSPRIKDWCDLLHGQALLAEGSSLPDPARFGRLVSDLMLSARA